MGKYLYINLIAELIVKKLIAIFLLIAYTATAFGVAINHHYCNGQLANVSVVSFGGGSDCSCNTEAMPKGCCKDKLLYQKTDSHRTIQESYTINTISIMHDLPPVYFVFNTPHLCIFSQNISGCDYFLITEIEKTLPAYRHLPVYRCSN